MLFFRHLSERNSSSMWTRCVESEQNVRISPYNFISLQFVACIGIYNCLVDKTDQEQAHAGEQNIFTVLC